MDLKGASGMTEQNDKIVNLPVIFYRNGGFSADEDVLVRETPVTLYLNDVEFVTLVCSLFSADVFPRKY
jgi:FdhD protein